MAKCVVAAAAAGGSSARGFGGASAAPAASSSKRAAATKGSNSATDDNNAAKQLAETRAALREALDELAAMSAKAEVREPKKNVFRDFLAVSFSRCFRTCGAFPPNSEHTVGCALVSRACLTELGE